MRSRITVIFDNNQSVELSVDVVPSEQASRDARDWLDAAWDTLGCKTLEPAENVQLVHKVIAVAGALGYETLKTDVKERQEFALHTALALNQPRVTVDLPGGFVGYGS